MGEHGLDGVASETLLRPDGGPIVGYAAGTFDMFHIGHLNVLRRARMRCGRLVVGVSTDSLVMDYKGKHPVVPLEERLEIVSSIKYVDEVIEQHVIDKRVAWEAVQFDRLFVGDDHAGEPMWAVLEQEFPLLGVEIVYLPYTVQTSSTLLRERLLTLPASVGAL